MYKTLISLMALFISALLVQACGNLADNSDPAPATALPAQFTTGTYTTQITIRDIHPQLAADLPAGASYLGKWEFNFGEQGRFSASVGGQVRITGQYRVLSEEMSFTSQDWAAYCPETGGSQDGIYSRYFDGQALALYPIQESCAIRLLVLSAHPLIFSGSMANNPNSDGEVGGHGYQIP